MTSMTSSFSSVYWISWCSFIYIYIYQEVLFAFELMLPLKNLTIHFPQLHKALNNFLNIKYLRNHGSQNSISYWYTFCKSLYAVYSGRVDHQSCLCPVVITSKLVELRSFAKDKEQLHKWHRTWKITILHCVRLRKAQCVWLIAGFGVSGELNKHLEEWKHLEEKGDRSWNRLTEGN